MKIGTVQLNRRMALAVLAGSCCGLLFGYDIGGISSAIPGLTVSFSLPASALGLAVSSSLFGTIAGSILAGLIADAIDRRHTLCIAALVYGLSVVCAAGTHGFAAFIVFRSLCGVAIGLISVAAPMYLAEIAPAPLRGGIVSSFQLNVSLGVLIAFVLGDVFFRSAALSLGWRYMLAIGAVPALLSELLLLKAPASPRWLVLKGQPDKARAVVTALGFSGFEGNEKESAGFRNDRCSPRQASLFSRQYLRPIVLAISIAVFNQLTGVNALLYYVLNVFRELGQGRLNGRGDAIIIAALGLIVSAFALVVIDRCGRKPLLLAGAAGMGICLALLPVVHILHWPVSTVVLILVCYNIFFGFSQGAVIWVYLSEIFPLPVRAQGQSLGSTVLWLTNALVVFAFPVALSILGGKIFVLFAALMAIQFLMILLIYPETKNISLEALSS